MLIASCSRVGQPALMNPSATSALSISPRLAMPQLPIRAVSMMPSAMPGQLPQFPRLIAPAFPPASLAASRDLKVMTFNLRVATVIDGLNTWGMRRGMVVERIRECDPDLLGTQEGLGGQTDFLREQLSNYTFFGVGRNDGNRRGEMCGIFYRTSRFEQLDGGHFWLSKHPDKIGSKGWGAWFPRMVTWVKLQPRDSAGGLGGQPIVFFNTHLDAWNSRARSESAKLLLDRINRIAAGSPSILTGDFNADQGSDPYVKLTAAMTTTGPMLLDAFRAANPVPQRGEGTRHSFRGGRSGPRIDWIMTSPCFQAVTASIDRARGVLGYPSDHYPVVATLRLSSPSSIAPMARSE
ncbi:MAG: endonuclease/exonuclease/phosphatase family protein [Tepidisphaeraceae bacterium]